MNRVDENVVIRKLQAKDVEAMEQIQEAITQSREKIDFRQILKEQVRKDEDVSFAAEIDGAVVGYMISYVLYGGFGLEKSAWIATLGVHPKFMGHGLGKRLAEETLRVYREKGIKNVYTTVRWDSVDLLSFFKTLGFDRSNFINLRKVLDI